PKVILRREDLLSLTTGRDALPYDRSIDNAIMRLRRKLVVRAHCPRIIQTIWGGGYMFAAEPVTICGCGRCHSGSRSRPGCF
ncbi:MAG: winged helix-turn-helix domain-containing protein, partial [Phycisphaerae bacterium]